MTQALRWCSVQHNSCTITTLIFQCSYCYLIIENKLLIYYTRANVNIKQITRTSVLLTEITRNTDQLPPNHRNKAKCQLQILLCTGQFMC